VILAGKVLHTKTLVWLTIGAIMTACALITVPLDRGCGRPGLKESFVTVRKTATHVERLSAHVGRCLNEGELRQIFSLDGWHRPLRISCAEVPVITILVSSAGPDGTFGSADDIDSQ
jgi:hypothetical protein